MAHKVFISFKAEDLEFKDEITALPNIDYIDKSLTEPIGSENQDYIMQRIRADYLYDSTVTAFLIGSYSAENLGEAEQFYIKKELQASLYTSEAHSKNGILGIVLPDMQQRVFSGSRTCSQCGNTHNLVNINDETVIKEFSYNYYIPHDKCAWADDDRYCVLTTWDDFSTSPNRWIDAAYDKRWEPIANKTRVRP